MLSTAIHCTVKLSASSNSKPTAMVRNALLLIIARACQPCQLSAPREVRLRLTLTLRKRSTRPMGSMVTSKSCEMELYLHHSSHSLMSQTSSD
jgi:hypothetical protein